MKGKLQALAILALLVGTLLAACGGGQTRGNAPYKVGSLYPLTGPMGNPQYARGTQMAVDEINQAGGIDGHTIELVSEDDEAQSDKGVLGMTKLTERDSAMAVLGGLMSDVSLATMPIAEKNKTIQFSPLNSLDALDEKKNPYYFRMGMSDGLIIQALLGYVSSIYNMKDAKVGILYDKTPWGIGGMEAFKKQLGPMGNTPVANEPFDRGSPSFVPQLTRLRESGAQIVYINATTADGARIAQNFSQINWAPVRMGGAAMGDPKTYQASQGAVDGMFFVDTLDDSRQDLQEFKARYKQKYNEDVYNWATVHAYDGMRMLAEALKTGKGDKEKTRQALENLTGFKTLIGPAGYTVSFSPSNHLAITLKAHMVKRWVPGGNGKQEIVWVSKQ